MLYVPLADDGVFGKGLEENLTKRKEHKEKITDLIPDYDTSKVDNNSQKRKFSSSNDRETIGVTRNQTTVIGPEILIRIRITTINTDTLTTRVDQIKRDLVF